MNRFGGAVDSAEGAGLMIVGDEFSEIDGYEVAFQKAFMIGVGTGVAEGVTHEVEQSKIAVRFSFSTIVLFLVRWKKKGKG